MHGKRAVMARLLPIIAVGAAIAMAARIVSLNTPYMEREPIRAAIEQELRCDWATPLNTTLRHDELTIRVTDFRIVGQSEERSMASGYVDPVLESKGASESKLALVSVTMKNTDDRDLEVPVTALHLQSGAWTNGVDMTLFNVLNHTADTVCGLEPGSEAHMVLPYHLYDTQFNSMRAWQQASERSFELVVTLMPAKAAIQLGSPGHQKGA